jgi:DNA-binding LacI/PurR family transcriptional regulator
MPNHLYAGAMPLRPPPLTMIDLAKKLGVSKATVSKALSAHPFRCDVSHATVDRIRTTAAELGYRPGWRTRTPERSLTVALVFDTRWGAPFLGGVYEPLPGILAQRLVARDHDLVLLPLASGKPWKDAMRGRQLDACIVMQPAPVGLDAELADQHWRAVWFNQETSESLDQVLPDDGQAVRTVIGHLRALGHQRLGYLETDETAHHSYVLRRQAFLDDVPDGLVIRPGEVLAATQAGITGFVAYGDIQAMQALQVWHQAGIACPAQVSVASCATTSLANLTWPTLTGVSVPIAAMADASIDLILGVRDQDGAPRTRLLPGEFVLRGSTGPAGQRNLPT